MNYDNVSFWTLVALVVILLVLCGFLLFLLHEKEQELKEQVIYSDSYRAIAKKTDKLVFDAYRDQEYLRQKLSVAREYLTQSVSVRIMNKDIRNDIREFLKGL